MKQMLWIAITLVSAACVAQIETAAVDTLRITLPSEAIAVGSQVRLSEVASLDGASALIEKANDLTLGTFISKGQVIQIDRNTIRSRLAGLGIDGSRVEFNGAQSVSVKRKECVLDSNTIAQAAKTYLEKQVADKKIASLSLFRSPAPMVFEDPNMVPEINCQMSRYQTSGSLKVDVIVRRDGLELGRSEVVFAVRYKVRQAVAIQDIQAGQVATTENIQMQDVETVSPNQKDEGEPYGMQARRKITKGSVVHTDSFTPPQSPVMIRRNQQVMVVIDTGALYLSAPGQALDEGRVGDLIRVRRGQRPEEVTIYAKVQPDGTVQPQL